MTANAFLNWATAHVAVSVGATIVLTVALIAATLWRLKAHPRELVRRKFSAGVLAAVVAFIVCTSVSLNTSYGFTRDGLGMVDTAERILSCAAFESLIAMCVLGARERLASDKQSPGWFGTAVWIFAGLSSVPAWHEGHGFTPGFVVRVIVGSFGSALAAHSALGLELRHRTGAESQSPMAMVARDLRERLMARLGLSQRGRTAEKIARDRALSRAVDLADRYDRLAEGDRAAKGAKLAKKLAKALDRAGCADDEAQRELFRSRVALRRFATELVITPAESPWHEGGTTQDGGRAADELEERINQLEELANETEAALAAQLAEAAGTPARAPRAKSTDSVAQTFPRQPGPQTQRGDRHNDIGLRDLRSYPTKRAALEALYGRRIAETDPRPINAITEELLRELDTVGITLDRGSANRYIKALHKPQDGDQDDAAEAASQNELLSA